jgi:hypothetical protein
MQACYDSPFCPNDRNNFADVAPVSVKECENSNFSRWIRGIGTGIGLASVVFCMLLLSCVWRVLGLNAKASWR